eukprot:8426691-Pyramimonas_sp.AAC.1
MDLTDEQFQALCGALSQSRTERVLLRRPLAASCLAQPAMDVWQASRAGSSETGSARGRCQGCH